MIEVIRIIGESIDLRDLTEVPSSLVLSNGLREVQVAAPPDLLETILRLRAEVRHAEAAQADAVPEPPPTPRAPPQPPGRENGARPASARPAPTPTPGNPTFDPAEPTQEELDEADREPGEEYTDTTTGVASF